MDAIARELRTSRSTVSRLLSFARETGLVQIQIWNPLESSAELESAVVRRYGIRAHVVPHVSNLNEAETLDRVAMYAARTLTPLVSSNAVVGVAWGSTLSAMSRYLNRKSTHGTTVVQLNGAANTQTMGLGYASEIMHRFGAAYDAAVEEFPVPAFFDRAETKRLMWHERSVRRVLDIQARMSLAVFGIGSIAADVPSHVYAAEYLDADDTASLAREGVVGDVATVFFREDGSSDGITLNERATGPDHRLVRSVPHRFCVVSGSAKARSLRGALHARLITELVADEATVRALLALDA
ncbi:sugar-binding domain-containing protein [Sinomonas sp. JGH33]|uniref:Sugar-binding domain-containing protein n=2 Tax=Sinomonas terricola TaxID=3110330 RepID=A0ABU5T793_9MICC|nr:sugar-binding domain-containing protein [Sinomonas sp. JGH33]MEA5455336.1 sugar-binding domain-containing protein [Sinomonas sp. JGH33]